MGIVFLIAPLLLSGGQPQEDVLQTERLAPELIGRPATLDSGSEDLFTDVHNSATLSE